MFCGGLSLPTRFHDLWNLLIEGSPALRRGQGTQQSSTNTSEPKTPLEYMGLFPQGRVWRTCMYQSFRGLSITFNCASALPLGVMLASRFVYQRSRQLRLASWPYGWSIRLECIIVLHRVNRQDLGICINLCAGVMMSLLVNPFSYDKRWPGFVMTSLFVNCAP